MHTHTYTHNHIYTYIHTYTHTYNHKINKYIHTYITTHTYIYTYIYSMEKEVCLGVTAGGVHIYHCAFRAQILPKKQDPNNIVRTVCSTHSLLATFWHVSTSAYP
jgi:hypothetical protein